MLDDLDLLPPSDLPLYLHQWFVALEQCVLAQRVQWYGVASSRIGRPLGAEGRLSVKQLIDTARGIVDRPHFTAIRFPLSVYDCSVAEELNCEVDGRWVSSLDYAKAKGLLCISEGLIDTVDAKGEERRLLTSVAGEGPAIADELAKTMNAAMFLEKQFQAKSEGAEGTEGRLEGAVSVDRLQLSWAHVMAAQMPTVNNAVRWERILDTVIRPTLRTALSNVAASYPDEHPIAKWSVDYRRVTSLLFSAFTHSVNHTAAHHSNELNTFLHDHCPALRPFQSVEEKSLVLALCVGVDVVSLCEVGMVALNVLRAAWKAEAKDVGEGLAVSSEVEASFPTNILSRDEALALMKKCREEFMDR